MSHRCNTELIGKRRTCGAQPARVFTAVCSCLHEITGFMCEPCGLSRLPGCLTCWAAGAGHQCHVEFTSAECFCGCERPVPIATRNQARDKLVKGRPKRYLQGHNSPLAAAWPKPPVPGQLSRASGRAPAPGPARRSP